MKHTLLGLTLGTSIVIALFGSAAPAMAAPTGESHQVVHVSGKNHYIGKTVRAGSFCSYKNKNWYGYTSKHKLMKCKVGNGDTRLRWRAV